MNLSTYILTQGHVKLKSYAIRLFELYTSNDSS